MGAKIREALKLRFDKRLRLEPMAEMLRVVWEVLSRIDNHMRWVYHRRQDRRWTKISSLRVEMGNPAPILFALQRVSNPDSAHINPFSHLRAPNLLLASSISNFSIGIPSNRLFVVTYYAIF